MSEFAFPEWVSALPEVGSPFPGARGRLIGGADGQVVLWTFEERTVVPPHRHGPQLGMVVRGKTLMTIGDDTRVWGTGETFAIGDQVEHSAVVEPGTLVVEIFQEHDRHKPLSS